MIKVAIVNSNFVSINSHTKKGTEIFDYILIRQLARESRAANLKITAFASGDSQLPVKIESVNYKSSINDPEIGVEHHKTFELALISKALQMQKQFDIFHINIGNGDVVLPLAPTSKIPILVTMHGSFLEEKYNKKYLSLFKNLSNIYFVSISDAQRIPLPNLNYIDTIPHGINERKWKFNASGGDSMIWAGRAIREKGISDLISVVKKVKKSTNIYPMVKDETPVWMRKLIEEGNTQIPHLNIKKPLSRNKLAREFMKSKLFLFPIHWEEPFGLVLIEALSCGTPVIAYARGSVPEVIIDGVTGFIVNPSPEDIRGNYIIKKTGIEGLCEGVKRIYAMNEKEYKKMRQESRNRVEKYFTVQQMGKRYIETYKNVIKISQKKK